MEASAKDLAHVMRRWQQAGITVRAVGVLNNRPPEEITVQRPSMFGGMLYRALMLMGLGRNSAGGFGSVVPQPSQG